MHRGDQVWDSDFEHWEDVASVNFTKKVGTKDVVRRPLVDLHPLLRAFITQIEKLRLVAVDEQWWQEVDAYLAEGKRRLGLKSLESVDIETGICKPAPMVEADPNAGVKEILREEIQEFRRRNRKNQ